MSDASKVQHAYGAEQIQVLEGLEPVRKRPGMYIGSTGPRGLHHLVYEVVDNSVDEALAGHCDRIVVVLGEDGSASVSDNGRGIPTDVHPRTGKSALETVLTVLHAGGKFGAGGYKVSGGLHGVGVSVVNALSKKLSVEIKREGHKFEMNFNGGEKISDLKKVGDIGARNTGTAINILPDDQYFETTKIDKSNLKHLLKAKAVLCSGLTVEYFDEKKNEKILWNFESGLISYYQNLLKILSYY